MILKLDSVKRFQWQRNCLSQNHSIVLPILLSLIYYCVLWFFFFPNSGSNFAFVTFHFRFKIFSQTKYKITIRKWKNLNKTQIQMKRQKWLRRKPKPKWGNKKKNKSPKWKWIPIYKSAFILVLILSKI